MKSIYKIVTLIILFCTTNIAFAAEYYWVGGSGNWSDVNNHWRTTSGGSGVPSVVPGPTDNVIFDANSGFTDTKKTITLDNTAICKNITFSGSAVPPNFFGNENSILHIYGSSVWQAGMALKIKKIFYKNNGLAKTITSNGVEFNAGSFGTIFFEETTSVSMLDNFNLSGTLFQSAGTWNTNDHSITVREFTVGINLPLLQINLGSSQIYLTSNYGRFNVGNTQVTLIAGTSHIHFTKGSINSDLYGIVAIGGQNFYDVSFEDATFNGTISTKNGDGKVKFNKVEFFGDGVFYGNNEFLELKLAAAKTYQFPANKTQTIASKLTANTTLCDGWSTLKSSSESGTKAKIMAGASTIIDVSGIIIKDFDVSGGANFNALNSQDAGNNSGWSFGASALQYLYWVGGEGNWNDKSHWSQTSGGPGGYCVPGINENVFFDANSGLTSISKNITIDNISYCRDITFAGINEPAVPVLVDFQSNSLNIYGSSVWQSGMKINLRNIYYRNSNQLKTIKSNGVIVGPGSSSAIYFEEKNTISLSDNFNSIGELQHNAGTLNTNNYQVRIESFKSRILSSDSPGVINLGSSTVFCTNRFDTNTNWLTLNAGTSHIHMTNIQSVLAPRGLQTFYDITFDSVTGKGIYGAEDNDVVSLNKFTFKGEGKIIGNNNFAELNLAAGNRFEFPSNQTQTITSKLSSINALCEGWTTFQSSTTATKANIVAAASTTIDVSGVVMQDVFASGGAAFTAFKSVDNGNNGAWNFPANISQNLFWVGGSGNWNDKAHWSLTSGGAGDNCIPGPSDNVFFDVNSGFTALNKTVTMSNFSYCNNITFAGSATAPVIERPVQNNRSTLNVYGSSIWQAGMEVKVEFVTFKNTNNPKTITSNTAILPSLIFEETTSISLLDNLNVENKIEHKAGTWNTNNHSVNTNDYETSASDYPIVLNLGSSNLYLNTDYSSFETNKGTVTLNAGTSHIHFTKTNQQGYNRGLIPGANQTFYNISFDGQSTKGTITGAQTGVVYFNNVEFKGDALIYGNNQFKKLVLAEGKSYQLQAGFTQTVTENLTLGGTPCYVTFMSSISHPTSQAKLNVTGGPTTFNFGNLKGINAITTLHFGEQSTIANQNNTNITFDPYNPGNFKGLDADKLCHTIDVNDSSTYIIKTDAFYGNDKTQYKWFKLNGTNYEEVSTSKDLNILTLGYGTYRVEVNYDITSQSPCEATDEILIVKQTEMPTAKETVCISSYNTLADIQVSSISGAPVKWYASQDSNAELPLSSTITNGQIYYLTQTNNNCESLRKPINITLKKCYFLANPMIRTRVSR